MIDMYTPGTLADIEAREMLEPWRPIRDRYRFSAYGTADVMPRTDPVLRSGVPQFPDERTWSSMEYSTLAISSAMAAVFREILGAGWAIKERRSTPAAKRLASAAEFTMSSIPKLSAAFRAVGLSHYYGWTILHEQWDTSLWREGRPWWGIKRLKHQRNQHLFAFTMDESLVYRDLAEERVFRQGHPMWLMGCNATDSPYGDAVLARAFFPWKVLQMFMEYYQRSVRNAVNGVPHFHVQGNADPLKKGNEQEKERRQIEDRVQRVAQSLERHGALVTFPGLDLKEVLRLGSIGQWHEAIERIERQFTILAKGELMTSESGSSRAQADVHENTFLSYCKSVARDAIGEPWNEQVIRRVIGMNYAQVDGVPVDPDDIPEVRFRIESRATSEWVGVLLNGGARINAEPLAREHGIELAAADTVHVLERQALPSPAVPGLPPQSAEDRGGDATLGPTRQDATTRTDDPITAARLALRSAMDGQLESDAAAMDAFTGDLEVISEAMVEGPMRSRVEMLRRALLEVTNDGRTRNPLG